MSLTMTPNVPSRDLETRQIDHNDAIRAAYFTIDELRDRMLGAIGLWRVAVVISTAIRWRPAGDRAPSVPEVAICRRFIERPVELAERKAFLLFGNLTARFFLKETSA
ncbi:MAG: hypothetical protein K0M47_23550, partial [Rhizobium sp.]|nr:hypothetical protein [Rhizobium sp.]